MDRTVKSEELISDKNDYTKKDIAAALFSVLLGWFITEKILFAEKTVYLSAAVCSVLFLGFSVLFYGDNVKSGIRYFLSQIVVIVLFTVNIIIGSNIFIRNLNILAVFLASDYFVYSISSGKINPGIYYIKEIFGAVFEVPVRYFKSLFGLIRSFFKWIKTETLKTVLTGLALSLPIIIIVVPLLAAADKGMETLFFELIEAIAYGDKKIGFIKILLTLAAASRIFAVIYGNKLNVQDEKSSSDAENEKKYIKPLAIVSMIFPLCILYVIFFCTQLGYFMSAFFGKIPDDFSYSGYARRGFFELCSIAAINLGVIIFINFRCEKEDNRPPVLLKACTVSLSFFTEVLIATALSKMIMYISCYGFTPSRVYPTIFMIAMAVFFIMMIIRQFADSFDLRTGTVITILAALLFVSYGRIDARIAQFNIALYKAGITEGLDTELLGELSDEAVPYIHALAVSDDAYARKAEKLLKSRSCTSHEFNFSSYRAEKILKKYR